VEVSAVTDPIPTSSWDHPDASVTDPDAVIFEATTSAFGGDVDEAGHRLVVLSDRVQALDAKDRLLASIDVAAITHVEVRRRLTSSVLRVHGTDGAPLELKGVKPAKATAFRAAVVGILLAREDRDRAVTPTAEALRRLDALVATGLLTRDEVASRRAALVKPR
jgi:hypothetical protein